MRVVSTLALLLTLLGACVTPKVIIPASSEVNFRQYKSASLTVSDLVNTSYSLEALLMFEGLMSGKLRVLGYDVVDDAADLNIEVMMNAAKKGNKALQFFVGFGAGRALLTFDAAFFDASGKLITSFSGGKSYHGQEFGNSALYKSHEDMQMGMIQESVKQIAEFIQSNGRLD